MNECNLQLFAKLIYFFVTWTFWGQFLGVLSLWDWNWHYYRTFMIMLIISIVWICLYGLYVIAGKIITELLVLTYTSDNCPLYSYITTEWNLFITQLDIYMKDVFLCNLNLSVRLAKRLDFQITWTLMWQATPAKF